MSNISNMNNINRTNNVNKKSTLLIDYQPHYLHPFLQLNNQSAPAVNELTQAAFIQLQQQTFQFPIIIDKNTQQLVAFLLTLTHQADYDSINYQWFKKNYDEFIYIDRIAVHPNYHRLGLASQLYQHLFTQSQKHHPQLPIACEVNIKPYNAQSLAFHNTHNFNEVGQQNTDNGNKRVSLLIKNH